MAEAEERNRAYGRAVPTPDFACLYKNLSTALAVLRIARERGELAVDAGSDDDAAVRALYERLVLVERYILDASSEGRAVTANPPFIIAVEGLDGSGKTTCAEEIAKSISDRSKNIRGVAMSTPPQESMSGVRDVFDKTGGSIARAFYMVSNYVLLYDIWEVMNAGNVGTNYVVVVDRWYTSTVAYTIGYKNTTGGPENIDVLDSSLFAWPHDLQSPDLVVLLKVDDEVRRERVRRRAEDLEANGGNHNPWDERLAQDPDLARRIFRSFERAAEPFDTLCLDANQSQDGVRQDALAAIEPRVQRHFFPACRFKQQPLEMFVWASSQMGLCDPQTGRRLKHKPWAMQLALNNTNEAAPSLRTVGIHTANEAGILFFSRGDHPGGAMGGDERGLASMAWVGGSYPYEQQWRAEGVLTSVSSAECQLLGSFPPASLVGQNLACHAQSMNEGADSIQELAEHAQRLRPRDDAAILKALDDGIVRGTRFIPLRMEVLLGGPSSPGGPRRYEWKRTQHSSSEGNGWTEARSMLPFSPPASIASPRIASNNEVRPMTIALTGTHCSGKSTIGLKLASVMNWDFHRELGDILRKEIPQSGHRCGYSSGANNDLSWDEYLHLEECRRDLQLCSRVVETWHIGNLGWALLRNANVAEKETLVDRAKKAVREHCKSTIVLSIHLYISPEAMLRRRWKDEKNRGRLPMTNEESECDEIHSYLDSEVRKHLDDVGIPTLVVDNSEDGGEDETTAKMVRFIHRNLWRCIAWEQNDS